MGSLLNLSGSSLLKKASAPHDYSLDYLTFVALEDGTFTFTPQKNNVISYSTNGGETWTNGNSVRVNSGNKVMWKGSLTPASSYGMGTFSSTGRFEACGNVMSLLFKDSFIGKTDLTDSETYTFHMLFGEATNLVRAENLSLPATILKNYCYQLMFKGCTSLITAPKLPATTLASQCYGYMFQDCTSLVTAPELPATTLKSECYYWMFNGCTSLTSAPELPALSLTTRCYNRMFYNCSSLNYIKVKCTTKPSTNYSQYWLTNVAASGTFVKTGSWTVTRSTSCVPTNWTVVQASD